MSELEQLRQRIVDLEAEVAKLRAEPQTVHHYHHTVPAYVPQPSWQPSYPPQYPQVWCGGIGTSLHGMAVSAQWKA